MSLRLLLATLWMPAGALRRELLRVEQVTNRALDSVLSQNLITYSPPTSRSEGNDLAGIRARMAKGHRLRVDLLLRAMGEGQGMALAREALFQAGTELGGEARTRLKVGDGERDLERAVKVLYRVLGIDVSMTFAEGRGRMRVRRCSLSPHYSEATCAVLSAADEGMVRGLNPKAEMRFLERITSGKRECLATIMFQEDTG